MSERHERNHTSEDACETSGNSNKRRSINPNKYWYGNNGLESSNLYISLKISVYHFNVYKEFSSKIFYIIYKLLTIRNILSIKYQNFLNEHFEVKFDIYINLVFL